MGDVGIGMIGTFWTCSDLTIFHRKHANIYESVVVEISEIHHYFYCYIALYLIFNLEV